MGDTLKIYDLAQGGVNVVKNPLKMLDNECRQAQNAIFSPDLAGGGVRKRGGLTRLNASAMNSGAACYAALGVQLPDPNKSTKYLYAPLSDTGSSNTWVRSTDGTSWSTITSATLARAQRQSKILACTAAYGPPHAEYYNQLLPPSVHPGKMLYFGDDYTPAVNPGTVGTNPPLRIYDGTMDSAFVSVPNEPNLSLTVAPQAITASCVHNGNIYIGMWDAEMGTFHAGRVLKIDALTGQFTIAADYELAGTISCLCSYLGQLFVGLYNVNAGEAGKVYRCFPDIVDGLGFTVDINTLNSYPMSMVVFKGNLYIGTEEDAAGQAKVYKRDPSGTYTIVKSQAGTPGNTPYWQLFVFNNTLFAASYKGASTDWNEIYSSTDGTSWSLDYDVYANNSSFDGRPCQAQVFNGALYWCYGDITDAGTKGAIFKRTTGGVWSKVYGNPAALRGMLTTLEIPQ